MDKYLDLIEIIDSVWEIYDQWRFPTYGWMYGLVGEMVGVMFKLLKIQ